MHQHFFPKLSQYHWVFLLKKFNLMSHLTFQFVTYVTITCHVTFLLSNYHVAHSPLLFFLFVKKWKFGQINYQKLAYTVNLFFLKVVLVVCLKTSYLENAFLKKRSAKQGHPQCKLIIYAHPPSGMLHLFSLNIYRIKCNRV